MPQKRSGRSIAYVRYTPTATLIANNTIIIVFTYTRSQSSTNANIAANVTSPSKIIPIRSMAKILSLPFSRPNGDHSDVLRPTEITTNPSCAPHHQISPNAAVFCSLPPPGQARASFSGHRNSIDWITGDLTVG